MCLNGSMLILASNLIGTSVFSVHAGQNVGKIRGWLVDLKDLKISIFVVDVGSNQTSYLLANDVRSLGVAKKPLVIIDYEEKLSAKEDLIRQREFIDIGINLIGFKVKTQSGSLLGKVKDLSLDSRDLYVIKLQISAKLLVRITNSSLLIDRTDIVQIKPKLIIVKDGHLKSKAVVEKPIPA